MNFETSPEIGALAEALAKFQGKVSPVPKDKTAKIPGRDGRAGYEYDYADLATIVEATKEARAEFGLSVTQFITGTGAEMTVVTQLMHASGQWIRGSIEMEPADGRPQTIGSLSTYLRRYGYSAALGISTEADDDGNSAQNTAATIQRRERTNAPPVRPQQLPPAAKHHESDPVVMQKITKLLNELGWAKPHAVNWLKKHFQADTFANLTADKVERVAEKLEMEAEAAKAEVERKAAAATKGQTT